MLTLRLVKMLKSPAINCGSLSVTRWSGMPCAANYFRNAFKVFVSVVVNINLTSGYFE